MIEKIKNIVQVNDDNFIDEICKDYKNNKVSITGMINVLNDRYMLDEKRLNKLMQQLGGVRKIKHLKEIA